MWPGVSEPVPNANLRILSFGAGVQSTTLALLAAHEEITPMPGIETEIEATIDTDPCFKGRYSILVSIPGIGLITAATLIAELSELGTLNAQKIAAPVGVA